MVIDDIICSIKCQHWVPKYKNYRIMYGQFTLIKKSKQVDKSDFCIDKLEIFYCIYFVYIWV